MRTFAKKELHMRRVPPQELGDLILDTISLHAGSPDPFFGIAYTLDIGPCLELAQQASERFNRKITFTHVLNKVLALAINENRVFNRIVLGRHVYEMEGISISNNFMLPARELAVTSIILENPHLKTLADIQGELILKMVQATRKNSLPKKRLLQLAQRLFFQLRLYCLIPEKMAYEVGFRNGIVSNIVLSHHDYGDRSNFVFIKPLIWRTKLPIRIHTSVVGKQPYVAADGALSSRETMHLNLFGDHRIAYGINAFRLGQSLERICAEPGKYLL